MLNPNKPALYYLFSLICLIIFLFSLNEEGTKWGGWLLMLFFLGLAIAFRQTRALRGLAFTVMIFAAVSLALYYPQHFIKWGDYSLSNLIQPLIMVIMFGMGTSMSIGDFAGVVKTPRGVMIGVLAQLCIMPLLGYLLASVSGLPAEVAAGIVLIGCSPSGLASNVMAYLAKANLALSITITSITTLLAPFTTPLLMKLLAGTLVEIDVLKMMWEIIKMIIIPIAAGLLFNKLLSGKSKWLDNAMPVVSMIGIGVILIVIVAAGRDSLLKIGPLLIILVLIHNCCGYLLGYWSARLLRLPERDCRTIGIEVGMQNGGLASGIAKSMGKIATLGLAPAVFGSLMNITGSALASWWHNRPPKDEPASPVITG